MIETRQEWLDKIIKRHGLDEEDIVEIVELFFDTYDESLSQIKKAYDDGVMSEFVRLTHGIKGAAANIGFEEVADIAQELEKQGNDNAVTDFAVSIAGLTEKVNARKQALGIS